MSLKRAARGEARRGAGLQVLARQLRASTLVKGRLSRTLLSAALPCSSAIADGALELDKARSVLATSAESGCGTDCPLGISAQTTMAVTSASLAEARSPLAEASRGAIPFSEPFRPSPVLPPPALSPQAVIPCTS